MNPHLLHSVSQAGQAAMVLVLLGLSSRAPAAELDYDLSGNLRFITNSTTRVPLIVAHPRSTSSAAGFTASFSVLARGSAPFAYQWQFNSNNISGANADTLFLTNLASNNFGAYRVVVSNAFGSVTSSNALLQIDSDRDGMADAWETNYFTSITNRSGAEDYDQDGVSDRDEFLEGTHPRFYSVVNPRLTIISDRGEVFVTPNLPLYTNNQSVTLTGVPDPGQQFLGYIANEPSYLPFGMRTNPAQLRVRAPLTVRAIFGLPVPDSLDVTNAWRIDQAGWFGQTNITHDGVDAMQSARMLGAPEAWLELSNVVLSAEGTITFWWKVDGTTADELRFYRNNTVRTGAIGTNTDWQLRTYYLPAGTNVVRWVYDKNGDEVSEYNGLFYAPLDAAWVDDVTYAVWPDPSRDSDSDGMRDIWELRYFDDIGTAPNADADRDGVSNLDEFLEGTNPDNNSSYLPRLTVLSSGGTVVLNPNATKYTLGQTVQLQAVPDTDNYFVAWGGAVSGTNTTNSVLMNRHQTVIALFGLPLPIALDTPGLSWVRGGPLGWFGQTNESHDKVDAAQSGPVGLRQESWMETTATGPATLMYWWKASSSANQNFGRLLIDGTEQPGKISGQTGWRVQSHFIDAGAHTLRWVYSNNTTFVSLTNGIWVDQVSLAAGTIPPAIFEHPVGATVLRGQAVSLAVQAGGTPPLSFQWFRNGVSVGASGTNSVLSLSFVEATDAGSYSVRVGNSLGTVTSSNATLTVLPVPPVNDDFANRTPLTGTNAVVGYTHGAYRELDEPNHAGMLGGQTVWWSWVAPASGNFRLRAASTNLLTPLIAAVYRGNSVNALTEVDSAVGTVLTNASFSSVALTFSATAGTSYAVVIDSGFRSAFLTLSILPTGGPAIGGIQFSTGGAFGFSFGADPGVNYVIQASIDLVTWVDVAAGVVPANGAINYTESSGSSYRFYRLFLPP
jgi:hypothetical protein